MGGVYDDALIRTPQGWRLSRRALTNSWITGDAEAIAAIGLGYLLAERRR